MYIVTNATGGPLHLGSDVNLNANETLVVPAITGDISEGIRNGFVTIKQIPPVYGATTRAYLLASSIAVTTSGSASAATAAVVANEVLLIATAAMWVTWGATPIAVKATAGSIYLAAGEKFHHQINSGDKFSAIQDTAAGVLMIVPVNPVQQ